MLVANDVLVFNLRVKSINEVDTDTVLVLLTYRTSGITHVLLFTELKSLSHFCAALSRAPVSLLLPNSLDVEEDLVNGLSSRSFSSDKAFDLEEDFFIRLGERAPRFLVSDRLPFDAHLLLLLLVEVLVSWFLVGSSGLDDDLCIPVEPRPELDFLIRLRSPLASESPVFDEDPRNRPPSAERRFVALSSSFSSETLRLDEGFFKDRFSSFLEEDTLCLADSLRSRR